MVSVPVEEAQTRLNEIIDQLAPGEELIVTRNDRPVARLTPISGEEPRPMPGRCKGMLTILAEDDEHLEDWREYMP